MHEWVIKKLFPKPYHSGDNLCNKIYRWYRFFDTPYSIDTWVDILCPKGCERWRWSFPGPLQVIGLEWIGPNLNVAPGYLYRLRDRNGRLVTFHEQWVVRSLRSAVENMKTGMDDIIKPPMKEKKEIKHIIKLAVIPSDGVTVEELKELVGEDIYHGDKLVCKIVKV